MRRLDGSIANSRGRNFLLVAVVAGGLSTMAAQCNPNGNNVGHNDRNATGKMPSTPAEVDQANGVKATNGANKAASVDPSSGDENTHGNTFQNAKETGTTADGGLNPQIPASATTPTTQGASSPSNSGVESAH